MANTIKFGIDFSVNSSGLQAFKKEIDSIQKMSLEKLQLIDPKATEKDLQGIKKSVKDLSKAFEASFNPKLGVTNISKFNSELKKLNIKTIHSDFRKLGVDGDRAFRHLTSQVLTSNVQLRQTHKILDDIAKSMANTVKWGITSSVFNNITNSMQKAWNYTVALDSSLNDIRIVTGKSSENMERFAREANKAALSLGQSTKSYTDASLIYYQQGLSDAEVKARTETTLKTANVTGQSARDVSEQLTAVWNGYKVNASEAELYIDKLSAVAAATASDLEELSTGMSKVASAANSMGVDVDQLNGMLSTIISVTKQAPESAGTALKTIFARMEDLKLNGEDESGVSLGQISGSLSSLGVEILDSKGNLKDLGDVIEDVGSRWNSGEWTKAQKQALSIELAGKRQYNNLIALFDGWEMYTGAVNISKNAVGTLQEQQDIYMERTSAHLKQLSIAWERVFNTFSDNEGINGFIDGLTNATLLLANMIESIGGGSAALLNLGAIGSQVFSRQLSKGISVFLNNIDASKKNAKTLNNELKLTKTLSGLEGIGEATKKIVDMKQQILNLGALATNEELNTVNEAIRALDELETRKENLEADLEKAKNTYKSQTGEDTSFGKENKDSNIEKLKKEKVEYIEINNLVKKATSTLEKAQEEYDNFDLVGLDNTRSALKKYFSVAKQADKAIDDLIKSSEKLIQTDKISEEQKDKLTKAIEEYRTTLNLLGKNGEDASSMIETDDAEKIQEKFENILNIVKEYNQQGILDINHAIKTIENDTQEALDQTNRAIKETDKSFNEFITALGQQESIQSLIQGLSGIAQAAQGLMALSNISDIIDSEDLSAWEKLLQVTLALSISIPEIVNGIGLIKKGFSNFIATVASGLDIAQAGFFATTGAILTTNVTLMGLTVPIWAIVAAVTALVAALGFGIYKIIEFSQRYEKAFEQARERTQDLNKGLIELSQSTNDFFDTFNRYQEGLAALEELEEGTEEYKKKLEDTNDAAKKLIETLGLTDEDYSIGKNGEIIIKSEEAAKKAKAYGEQKQEEQKSLANSVDFAKVSEETTARTKDTSDYILKMERDFYDIRKELLTHSMYLPFTSKEYKGKKELHDLELEGKDFSPETFYRLADKISKLSDKTYEEVMLNKDALIEWTKKPEQKDISTSNELIGTDKAKDITKLLEQNFSYIQTLTKNLRDSSKKEQNILQGVRKREAISKYDESIKQSSTMGDGQLNQSTYRNIATLINDYNPKTQEANNILSKRQTKLNKFWGAKGEKYLKNEKTGVSKALKELELDNPYKDIRDLESLTKEYAKTFKGLTDKQIEAMTYANGKLTSIDTNTQEEKVVADLSTEDKQGNAIRSLVDKVYMGKATQDSLNTLDENYNKAIISLIGKAQSADVNGENGLADALSQAFKTGSQGKTADFNIKELSKDISPEQAEKIKSDNFGDKEFLQFFGMKDDPETKIEWANAGKNISGYREAFQKQMEDEYSWNKKASLNDSMKEQQKDIDEDTEGMSKDKKETYNKELKEHAELLMDTAKASDKLADSLEHDSDAAVAVARDTKKLNANWQKLHDNFGDWNKILKTSGKETEEYSKALNSMREVVAGIADVDISSVSDDFFENEENMKNLEAAANGSAEAIDKVRQGVAEDIIAHMDFVGDVEDIEGTRDQLRGLMAEAFELTKDIQIGGIDLTNMNKSEAALFEVCKKILKTSGMTAQKARELFSTMGFEAKFKTEKKPVQREGRGVRHIWRYNNDAVKIDLGDGQSITRPGSMEEITLPGASYKYNDYIDVPALSTDGKEPTITSLVNTGGGSFAAGGSTKSFAPSSGGGRKGGGGGGKKTPSKPKKEKKLDKEIDPYHDIDIEIKKVSKELSKLQNQQKKFFGEKLINNLQQQWEQLAKSIVNYKEKIQIARGEAEKLRGTLSQKGVTFAADGTISNYAQAYQAQIDYVNGLIDKFNGMSAEAQEGFQETLTKAKEELSDFEKDLSEYDKTVHDLIPGLEKDIQSAIDKQIEIQIETFEMEIKIRLDIADAEREWNDFHNKIIKGIKDDDILGNAKAKLEDFYSYYKDNDKGIIQKETEHVNKILEQLHQMDKTGKSEVYGDNRKAALEDLKEYYKQLMDDMNNLHSLSKEIHKSYLSMMDEAQEKFNSQIEAYETISDLIEHDKNIIALMYGEEAYSSLAKYYQKQEDNYNSQLDFQKQQVELWKQQMEQAEKDSDEWEKAKENWMAAVAEWNSLVEASIENLQNKYMNAIKEIFQKINNELTDGKGLDSIGEQWDIINRRSEDYLDNVNAIYKTQQLKNKYLDAIEKSNNPEVQKRLNDLMDKEIENLREQDKLSQYDIDRAELKYQIALKQIALEEAQQNKSTMRLRRDSQGNYTYQYVADEDKIGAAQQELSDLYNQLYNLDTNKYRENLGEIYDIWMEFQEKMIAAGEIADADEKLKKQQEIMDLYLPMLSDKVADNEEIKQNLYNSTFSHLFDLYNQDFENYGQMTDAQREILDNYIQEGDTLNTMAFDNLFGLYNEGVLKFNEMTEEQRNILMESMIPQWDSGIQHMVTKLNGPEGLEQIFKNVFTEISTVTKDYKEDLNQLQTSAGTNFEEIKKGVDSNITSTQNLIKENDTLIKKYQDELGLVGELIGKLDGLISKYKQASDAAKKATEDAYKYWLAEQNKAADISHNVKPVTPPTPPKPAPPPKPAQPSYSGPQGNGRVDIGDIVTYSGRYYYDSYGRNPGGSRYSGQRGAVKVDSYTNARRKGPVGIHISSLGGTSLGWVRQSQISGYDTGGYTGDWNSKSGKLAFLHQKELVLNTKDTANMLNAVQIVRGIVDNLGASLLNKMTSIGSNKIGLAGIGEENNGIEQIVNIHADFPNATKSSEIENALNNLVNRASQYIKKR